jgi:hypothetical protein
MKKRRLNLPYNRGERKSKSLKRLNFRCSFNSRGIGAIERVFLLMNLKLWRLSSKKRRNPQLRR